MRFLRIGNNRPHFVAKAVAVTLIPRFQIAFVLDRVPLDIFERDQSTLKVVAIELLIWTISVPYVG